MTIVSPVLTGNTTPSQYTASASSNNTDAYKVFDGNNSTSWIPASNSSGEWVAIDIAFNRNINGYSITCPNVSTQAPTDFKLQGTLNGTTWYDLDIQSGLSSGWTDNIARSFICNNLSVNVLVIPAYGFYVAGFTYFKNYRLYFTSQPSASVNIAEFVLLSTDKNSISEVSDSTSNFATLTANYTSPVPNYVNSQNILSSISFREGTYVPDTNTYNRPLTGQLFPRGLYFGAESLTINNTTIITDNYPVYNYPHQYFSSTFTNGYSVVRKLNSSYSGSALKIKRASDNALLDVGFTSNGAVDVNAVLTFLSGTTGIVDILYDQIGSKDLTHGTDSIKPRVYFGQGNQSIAIGRKNTVVNSGGSDALWCLYTENIGWTSPYLFMVFVAQAPPELCQGGSSTVMSLHKTGVCRWGFGGVSQNGTRALGWGNTDSSLNFGSTVDITKNDRLMYSFNKNASGWTIRKNGSSFASVGDSSTFDVDARFAIGAERLASGQNNSFSGLFFETLIGNNNISNAAAIETEINSYHNVY